MLLYYRSSLLNSLLFSIQDIGMESQRLGHVSKSRPIGCGVCTGCTCNSNLLSYYLATMLVSQVIFIIRLSKARAQQLSSTACYFLLALKLYVHMCIEILAVPICSSLNSCILRQKGEQLHC